MFTPIGMLFTKPHGIVMLGKPPKLPIAKWFSKIKYLLDNLSTFSLLNVGATLPWAGEMKPSYCLNNSISWLAQKISCC